MYRRRHQKRIFCELSRLSGALAFGLSLVAAGPVAAVPGSTVADGTQVYEGPFYRRTSVTVAAAPATPLTQEDCFEYRAPGEIDGREVVLVGKVCRQADGTWRLAR